MAEGSIFVGNANARMANANLAHSALHALKWRFTGTVLQVGLRFIIGVILTRLLSPEAFGIIGIALLVIGFGKLVGDLGFGVAIIQRPSVTQKHIRAAFTGSVTACMLIYATFWLLTPAISRLFAQESLTPILRLIGLSLILLGMSATPVCVLRRELRFRALASIEIVSYLLGFGVLGVPLALLGYGVWSLVAANIVQPLCLAVLAIYLTRQPVWPYLGAQEYCDLIRIASAEVLNTITNYTAVNLDFFVIGKWVGASALGLYNRSFYLMLLPVTNFSTALLNVMFPLYAKIQEDIPRLGRAYLRTVSLCAVVTMPILFAMAVVPEIIIGGLFGAQWKAAAGALRLLCLSGPFIAITGVGGALGHARGYVINEWWRQVIHLVIMGVLLYVLLPYGIEGVALAVLIARCARYIFLAELAVKLTEVGWWQFFLAQVPGILFAIPVCVSVYLVSSVMTTLGTSDILHLLVIVAVALFSLIVNFLLFPASWYGDLYQWIIERFGMSLPYCLYKLMNAKLLLAENRAGK